MRNRYNRSTALLSLVRLVAAALRTSPAAGNEECLRDGFGIRFNAGEVHPGLCIHELAADILAAHLAAARSSREPPPPPEGQAARIVDPQPLAPAADARAPPPLDSLPPPLALQHCDDAATAFANAAGCAQRHPARPGSCVSELTTF